MELENNCGWRWSLNVKYLAPSKGREPGDAQKFAVNKLKPKQENIKQLWVNEGTILMAKILLVVAQHALKCTFQGLQN